jgi:hypothetical protein
MAGETPNDAAAKARIIKHLNADHQASLSYYLQHFNSLSSFEARNPTLTNITFDSMTLKTAGGNMSTIPLYPPMTSWSEARSRTVEMDQIARTALDISSIRITEYEPPTSPFQVILFALCLLAISNSITTQWMVPGTFVYDSVLPWFPGGPEWYLYISNKIAIPTLVIHLMETAYLEHSRLRKHGVQRGTGLWFKWLSSCIIEGRSCFQRIDATVKRKEKEAAKLNH